MEAHSLRFELALVAGSAGEPIPLGRLLDEVDEGTIGPDVHTDDATLMFESDGVDRMPRRWELGNVASLGRQFAAAAARLRAGDIAIVRSAVDDRLDVASFLFEPTETAVAVSQFEAPPHLRFVYPTSPARGGELYDHVRTHRDELLARHGERADDILGILVPRDELIEALDREAGRAERVVALRRA